MLITEIFQRVHFTITLNIQKFIKKAHTQKKNKKKVFFELIFNGLLDFDDRKRTFLNENLLLGNKTHKFKKKEKKKLPVCECIAKALLNRAKKSG